MPNNTFDLPIAFGPVSGVAPDVATPVEGDHTMVAPNADLVARDLFVRFEQVSPNSRRRLVLRVDEADTALTCSTSGAGVTCSTPPDVEVDVPAGALLAWKTDNAGEEFNTAETLVLASFRLTED